MLQADSPHIPHIQTASEVLKTKTHKSMNQYGYRTLPKTQYSHILQDKKNNQTNKQILSFLDTVVQSNVTITCAQPLIIMVYNSVQETELTFHLEQ